MKGLRGQTSSQSAWQMGVPTIAQKIYSLDGVSTGANEASIAEPQEDKSVMGGGDSWWSGENS
jgi:hypothetical protein